MTVQEFQKVIKEQIERCEAMLLFKGREYAPNTLREFHGDRLSHIKKAAVIMNATPKVALLGMLSKHLISVSDMCTDTQHYSKEKWDEKITDSINYLLILRAIVEEELVEKDRSKNIES